jgi:hypothetical protein
MYARFLKEAASIAGEPRLSELATHLSAIGDAWEEVAAAFAEAAQADSPADLLDAATAPMQSIAATEEDLWERLAAVVGD